MLAVQGEFKYTFANKTSVAVAPMWIGETNGDLRQEEQAGTTAPAGENPDIILGDLSVLLIPWEVKWKMWELPWKAFGTYGYNFHANGRFRHASNDPTIPIADRGGDLDIVLDNNEKHDGNLFNIGVVMGENKKKGDWSLGLEYRYVEAFAWTGNLQDSDFAKDLLNQHGSAVTFAYNFTDFMVGGLTWYHSSDIDDSIDVDNALTTESDGNTMDVFQVDLSWKF